MRGGRFSLLAALVASVAGALDFRTSAAPAGRFEGGRSAAEHDDRAVATGTVRVHGWSVATDRRRAKKARNVARNRAAHRGRRS